MAPRLQEGDSGSSQFNIGASIGIGEPVQWYCTIVVCLLLVGCECVFLSHVSVFCCYYLCMNRPGHIAQALLHGDRVHRPLSAEAFIVSAPARRNMHNRCIDLWSLAETLINTPAITRASGDSNSTNTCQQFRDERGDSHASPTHRRAHNRAHGR